MYLSGWVLDWDIALFFNSPRDLCMVIRSMTWAGMWWIIYKILPETATELTRLVVLSFSLIFSFEFIMQIDSRLHGLLPENNWIFTGAVILLSVAASAIYIYREYGRN